MHIYINIYIYIYIYIYIRSPLRRRKGDSAKMEAVCPSRSPVCSCTKSTRALSHCRRTTASTAPCTSGRMCCLTLCASYCASCAAATHMRKGSTSYGPSLSPVRSCADRAFRLGIN